MDIDDLDKSLSDMDTIRIKKTVLGQIDRYEITDKLGEGGFGAVYGAKDIETGLYVALKSLPSEVSRDGEEMDEIRANFQLVSKLHHPVIASVLHLHRVIEVDSKAKSDLSINKDDYLVVMEVAYGGTLFAYRRKFSNQTLSLPDVIEICKPIAEALDYAHSLKILHRDIKPKNIMISDDGKKTVKILDFGLAAEIKSSMSRKSSDKSESTSGTPLYMAPEQWAGKRQDGKADQYALAAIVYELISGEVPFKSVCDSGNLELIRNVVLKDVPESIDSISKKENNSILKALSKDPNDRYQSCVDFINSLSGKSYKKPLKPLNKNNLLYLWIGITVFVVAVLFFIFNGGSKNIISPNNVQSSEFISNQNKNDISNPNALGICQFKISPDGTSVSIYGLRGLIHKDITPFNLKLDYGEYDIVAEKEGYDPLEQSLRVNSDELIDFKLSPRRGNLRISFSQEIVYGQVIAINKEGLEINLGEVPNNRILTYNRLLEGTYDVVIIHPDYEEFRQEIKVLKNQPIHLKPILEGLPGSLMISSEYDFQVYNSENKLLGFSNENISNIKPGNSIVYIERDGFKRERISININPNQQLSIVKNDFLQRSGIFSFYDNDYNFFDELHFLEKYGLLYRIINDPNDRSTPKFTIDWREIPKSMNDDNITLFPGKYILEFMFDNTLKFIKPINVIIKDDNTTNLDESISLSQSDLALSFRKMKILGDKEDAHVYLVYNNKHYKISKLNEEFLLKIPGQKYDNNNFSCYKGSVIPNLASKETRLIVKAKYYKDIIIDIPGFNFLDGIPINPFLKDVEFISALSLKVDRPKYKGSGDINSIDYNRYLNNETQTIQVDNDKPIRIRSWPVNLSVEPESKKIEFKTTGLFVNNSQIKSIRPKNTSSLTLDSLEGKKALIKLQITGAEIPDNIFVSKNGKKPQKFDPKLKSDINYSISPFTKEILIFSAEGYKSFKLELDSLTPGQTSSKFINFSKISDATKSRPRVH